MQNLFTALANSWPKIKPQGVRPDVPQMLAKPHSWFLGPSSDRGVITAYGGQPQAVGNAPLPRDLLCHAPNGLENLFMSERWDLAGPPLCLPLGNDLSCPHPSGQASPQGPSPFTSAPGCTFCSAEMPWPVRLACISAARDAGDVLRRMQTPGFSWHVLSELFSIGMKICAGGASPADSHPQRRWRGTAHRSADRRLLWSRDPWGSFRD